MKYLISAEDLLRLLILAGQAGKGAEAADILARALPNGQAEDETVEAVPPAKPE